MSESLTIEILHRVPISRNDELVWLQTHDRPTLPASIAQHLIDQGYAITTTAAIDDSEEPATICPQTGTYCSGDFCDEYGCAKAAGF